MKYSPSVSPILLRIYLVFPILLFSSISLHCSCCFLISPGYSLELWIQLGISFLFSFAFASLLFYAIYTASSDNHFAFLHFFFLAGIDWGQEEKRAIDDKWTWVWANSGRYRRTGKTGNAATHGGAKGQTRLSSWTNFFNFCNVVVTKKRLREISFFFH